MILTFGYNMAKSIQDQTGWARRTHQQLLQDISLLERVEEFDWDLNFPGFAVYAAQRGVLPILADMNTPGVDIAVLAYREFIADFSKQEGDYLNEEAFKYSVNDENGKQHLLSDALRRIHYHCLHIKRAKLQDVWEIFHSLDLTQGIQNAIPKDSAKTKPQTINIKPTYKQIDLFA